MLPGFDFEVVLCSAHFRCSHQTTAAPQAAEAVPLACPGRLMLAHNAASSKPAKRFLATKQSAGPGAQNLFSSARRSGYPLDGPVAPLSADGGED